MDLRGFQEHIPRWRTQARLTQSQLDDACGFRPGTVGRIERMKVKITDAQFVSILLATKRDLVWTLLENCGLLYRRLQPLEVKLAEKLGPSLHARWEDGGLQNALTELFGAARFVIMKIAKATDTRSWITDLFLRVAENESETGSVRKRVRKQRAPKQ